MSCGSVTVKASLVGSAPIVTQIQSSDGRLEISQIAPPVPYGATLTIEIDPTAGCQTNTGPTVVEWDDAGFITA
jgi:hypothetical protein